MDDNIAFSADLSTILSSNTRLPDNLAIDILGHIGNVLEHRASPADDFQYFDDNGVKLWNLAFKLREDESISTQLVCLGNLSEFLPAWSL